MLVGLTIFSLSSAALAYEVLLMKLLSIIQWHHFAYMIISLALLGYAASGTFIALFQRRLTNRFYSNLVINCLLFGGTALTSFLLINRIPLNPVEIFWDSRQFLYFLTIYLLLALPFFFAANCIGLCFVRLKGQIHRIYYFDLFGAGFGALAIIGLLVLFHPMICLLVVTAIGILAGALATLACKLKKSLLIAVTLAICASFLVFAFPKEWLALNVSEYKGLSMALRVPGAHIVAERYNPLGWLSVVESPKVPFRYAPGMSLNCAQEPPPQLGIFTDADSLSPITRFKGNLNSLKYLDCFSSAVPYHLMENPEVLILGAGGGSDVLMAIYHRAAGITAVEVDWQVAALVRQQFADFAGQIYSRADVDLKIAEARGFVGGTKQFDLIVVSLLDSFSSSTAGGYALNVSYLYTVEALQQYCKHLKPGGMLTITRWLKVPPRDSLKLFTTALEALKKSGHAHPERQLALIRSWRTSTLLVKNGQFTPVQIDSLRTFCNERSFDAVYFPGIKSTEANRYNLLDEPYFYSGVMALLGPQRDNFLHRYKFYINPATDDRPYFFHFFKWGILPEVLSLKGQGGLSLMEWTYPVLIATLVQAVGLSILLIIFPLRFLESPDRVHARRSRLILYFMCLGLAFLFVEIAFIQKFTLLLSHPVYAAASVLFAFLVFAGFGSRFSVRLERPGGPWQRLGIRSPVTPPVLGIILFSALDLALLPLLFRHCMALPVALKMSISLLLIAPLAFCMGMPFPLGLARVAQQMPDFLPWAWGINGCASVISAVLATVLAIHFGFNAVVGMAALLYVLAAVFLPGASGQ